MRKYFVAMVTLFLLLAGNESKAQVFIMLEGVEGESRFAAFRNSTELSSFSMGSESSVNIGSGAERAGAGKVSFSDISFSKPRGTSSASLQNSNFKGTQFTKGEVRFYRTGSTDPYLVIYLEGVFITSWKLEMDKGGIPMETFTMKYIKIKTEDWSKNPDGSIRKTPSSWDLSRNIAF